QAAEELARVAQSAAPQPALAASQVPAGKRSTPPLLVGIVVLVALTAVAATSFLLLRPAHGVPERPASYPSPSPASSTPGAQAGLQRATGPETESLAVPAGWSRDVPRAGSVRWTDHGTGAFAEVDSARWDTRDPVTHWQRF